MSDREFENYLALLTGMLRLRRTQREGISGELRDHLIEHVAQLEASGIAHEEAVRRALQEFGDAAALAANFQALVGMRRRRLVMRCTIGTTVVMTGLVVALLAFRPEVRNDRILAQAQAEAQPGNEKQPDAGKKKIPPPPRDPDQRTRLALRQETSIDFTETPLAVALATLGEQHGVQQYIDRRSLRDAGIDHDAAVTLNLDGVPLQMVLDLMLRELSLDYRIRNGVIVVASEEDVQSQTEVRVYEVPEEDAHSLLMLIAETVEPDSWRPDPQVRPGNNPYGYGAAAPQGGFGGVADLSGPGSIRAYRGVLVVSQTPEVHQKIEKLLSDLNRVLIDRPRRATTATPPPSETVPATQPGFGPPGQPPSSGGFVPAPGSPGTASGGSSATPDLPTTRGIRAPGGFGPNGPPGTSAPPTIDPANPPRPNTPPTFETPPGAGAPKPDSR
jgi:hypothetical protein